MNCLHKFACASSTVAVAVLLLSGCATVSSDGGLGGVARISQERLGPAADGMRLLRSDEDARALQALIAKKLEQPINPDDAIQIALLNNRSLQATYWSLGVAEADLVQAGRLHNPVLDFKRTREGGEVGIERTLTFNLIGALTTPLASRLEARRYEETRLLVAQEALKVAADTRIAWVEAVAAVQSAAYASQILDSAAASAELAGRMRKAGNWSQLDLAREQAYHAQAKADASHAAIAVVAAREKLVRLLGLNSEQAAQLAERLPDHLPDLPEAPRTLADVEQTALTRRLDIQAAKLETVHTADALGLTRSTRFINVLDLGAVRNSSGGRSAPGYELSLEVPLFDWGDARVARAEASYMQAVHRLSAVAVNARSEAREQYAAYRASYDLARHYRDEVIPVRKQISDQTLLRYNGMLMSVFELLADAREQAAAVNGYIGALKDFWLAHSQLEAVTGVKP